MVDVLARAFSGNLLNRVVIRSADPERCFQSNRHGMRALLPIARLHGQVLAASLNGRLVGGLVASPPGRFPLPPPPLLGQLRYLLRQGWRVSQRWQAVSEAFEALHPSAPHWYLATLGVDRPARRRGVGAALLSRWLEGVDRDGRGLFPMMPYAEYRHMADEDAMSIVAYLRTLAPVKNATPRSEIIYNVEPFRAGIRQGDWKLVWRTPLPSAVELYNIAQDPSEKNNVAARNPEKIAALEKRAASAGSRAPACTAPRKRPSAAATPDASPPRASRRSRGSAPARSSSTGRG